MRSLGLATVLGEDCSPGSVPVGLDKQVCPAQFSYWALVSGNGPLLIEQREGRASQNVSKFPLFSFSFAMPLVVGTSGEQEAGRQQDAAWL